MRPRIQVLHLGSRLAEEHAILLCFSALARSGMSRYHRASALTDEQTAEFERMRAGVAVVLERLSGFSSVEDMVERGVEIRVIPHPVYKSGRRRWVAEYTILPSGEDKGLSRVTFPNAPMAPTQGEARDAAKSDAEHAIRTMRLSIPGDEPGRRRTVDLVDLIGAS